MKRFISLKIWALLFVLIFGVAIISLTFLNAEKIESENRLKREISECGKSNSIQFDSERQTSTSSNFYWVKVYGCGKNGEPGNWESNSPYFNFPQSRDGGYILAVSIHPADSSEDYSDLWVMKLDSEGGIDWHRCYGGDLMELRPCIQTTIDGGYIVGSTVCSSFDDQFDFWIFKLNGKGDIEWQKMYEGSKDEIITSIHQTRNGGYIISGTTDSFGRGGALVMKLDSKGDIEWQHVYEGGIGRGQVLPTSDGGYLLIDAISVDGNWDAWVLKLDANGYSEWQRTYGGLEPDYGASAIQETSGGYLAICLANSFCATSSIWILKLTEKGDIEWQRTYDGPSSEWTNSILQTNDGGYLFLGGTVSFGAGMGDVLLLKLNPNGSLEWQRTYGEGQGELAVSVHQDVDGSYIIGGWSNSRSNRLLMMKMPQDGDIDAFCGIAGIPNMTCTKTNATSQEINIAPIKANIVMRPTNYQTQELDVCEEVICWNLNQAPVNISLRREVNRSLFRKEAFNIISWDPNPANDRFDITEYRIYRSETEPEVYELLAAVPGSSYEYVDGYLDLLGRFNYVVTSVDSEGRESPKSAAVVGGPF